MTPPPQAKSDRAALRHIGIFRFSTVEFLVALALLFIGAPFVETMRYGSEVETSLMTLVLVLGALAVGRSRRTLAWAAGLVIPAVTARWIHHFGQQPAWAGIFLAAALVYLIFLIAHFLHFILRAPRVNADVLCAGISVYLLLGLVWVMGYMLVAQLADAKQPAFAFNAGPANQSMTGFNAYYFSFITLTTVGYGDITPVSNMARALSALEAMTGTLYVAVLISRLVALYSSQAPPAEPGGKPQTEQKKLTESNQI
ncbi:MAG TPA: ion channel [Candidatus Acidoferrum sp.]|nr:ion channel [Candidatus Acidoferrum sp.]